MKKALKKIVRQLRATGEAVARQGDVLVVSARTPGYSRSYPVSLRPETLRARVRADRAWDRDLRKQDPGDQFFALETDEVLRSPFYRGLNADPREQNTRRGPRHPADLNKKENYMMNAKKTLSENWNLRRARAIAMAQAVAVAVAVAK